MTNDLPVNWTDHCEVVDVDTANKVEWLNARRAGFGGSDTYTLLGLKTYQSPADIILSKLREYKRDSEGNDATYWGTTLESVVATEFSRRSGLDVTELPTILRSKTYPWLQATVDRVVWESPDRGTILECKTGGYFRKDEWEVGVPEWVEAQVHHYMLVTGVDHAFVGALIGGQHYYHYRLELNHKLADRILAVTEAANSMLLDVKRGLVTFDGVDEAIKRHLPLVQNHSLPGVGIELGEDGLMMVGEHMEALEEYRGAKRRLDTSQKTMFEALGPCTIGFMNGQEIYRRAQKGRYYSVILPSYDDLE